MTDHENYGFLLLILDNTSILVNGTVTLLAVLLLWQILEKVLKGEFKTAIFLIIALGFLLRMFIAGDPFLHEWDERYHALVAKNLIDHPLKPTLYLNPVLPYDFRHWAGNHIWVHKQPLPLWLIAASLKIFGIHEFAVRIPSIVLSTIGIYLTYFIGKYFYGRKIGLLAGFFFSINGLILELSGGRVATDHIDIHFLFFIELGIAFSICYRQSQSNKWMWSVLIGLSIGAGILSKWLPALIVFPVWLCIAWENFDKMFWFHLLLALVATILVALPWQLYILNRFPTEASWEYGHHLKHITEELDGNGQPWYYHIDRIRIVYGEFIYLPIIWYSWNSLSKWNKPAFSNRLALLSWIWIPLIFFSLVSTKMQAYTLFIAPSLFIVTAVFWRFLNIWRRKIRSVLIRRLLFIAAILLIALPVRYTVERLKLFSKNYSFDEKILIKNMQNQFSKNTVIFNTNWPIEFMFYHDIAAAYSNIPSLEIQEDLKKKGFQLFFIDNGVVKPLY